MQQRSSAKADAAVAAKAPPKKASAPLGKTVAASTAAAPAKAIGTKPTTSPSTKSAKKGGSRGNVPTTAPAAPPLPPPPPPAPPDPTDREGLARVTYNHYNSFFPVDAAGKMLWRDIDDKYCLSYGAAHAACSASSAL
jgi:hypothetical protein